MNKWFPYTPGLFRTCLNTLDVVQIKWGDDYFAVVKNMLYFFCKLHILLNTSTFAKTNEQNNRDDSFEKRHFDEGRSCGEPPSTSLVQRSRMLMQKRPLFVYVCMVMQIKLVVVVERVLFTSLGNMTTTSVTKRSYHDGSCSNVEMIDFSAVK